ncbi:MAG: VOC family protein [Planctomycetes bacterium]|nr:VOC family protein [Planctomycetota bacterium]
MSKRPAKPAGMSWVSPYLMVKDAATALDFYQRAFGLERKEAIKGPDGRIMHAEVVWHDSVIMFGSECEKEPQIKAPATTGVQPPVALYLYCDDVDALFARATKAGARVGSAPQNQFYGDRTCKLFDPDGHVWFFATHVGDFVPPQ